MKKLSTPAQKSLSGDQGFTLVEVMVTMVIIGLLTTFVMFNVLPAQEKAKSQKAQADIRLLENALEQYRLDMQDYPEEMTGLAALTALPEGHEKIDYYRRGGYVKYLPLDPWGRPYVYLYPGEKGDYDLFSYGADGKPGGEGNNKDIVNWVSSQ